MVLIDSDALIGLRVGGDIHNKEAIKILKVLKEMGESLVTSWQVVDETATKLSYFTTHKQANEFLDWVFKTNIKVVYVDDPSARKAVKKFRKQKSKRVSLTDCTNMVIAEEMGVKQIFSFDKHYEKNGFELLKA